GKGLGHRVLPRAPGKRVGRAISRDYRHPFRGRATANSDRARGLDKPAARVPFTRAPRGCGEREIAARGDTAMRVYYDRDADVNLIKGKKVAVVGFGSQGHAHALNMRDSGVKDVMIALRPNSPSAKKAEGYQFKVATPAEAAKWADVMMVVTPDELQAQLWKADLRDNMKKGAAIAFAHGFNIHFNLIEPRPDLDVFMIAPKGPGHTVRSEDQRSVEH